MINNFRDGDVIDEIFLVKNVNKGISVANNNGYLNVTLQDKTGVIEGKKWSIEDGDLEIFKTGNVIMISGQVNMYKDRLQVKILNGRITGKDVDYSDILIESPIPVEQLIEKYKYYLGSVKNNDCKEILAGVFEKYYADFINYPAAVSNHHDFYHGLIYHTVSMCSLAEVICKHYREISYDLLISGCLLHDVGKVIEFNGPVATKYTIEGNLVGHISIGAMIIDEVAKEKKIEGEVPLLLKHMILAHHGKQEYGSPVLPATREALLLSMIDEMDSKIMCLDKAYSSIEEGEFTDRIYAFENRQFYKPHKL